MAFDAEGSYDLTPEQMIRDRSASGLHFRRKIPVAILGATGSVGQRLLMQLEKHPWFECVALVASDKSQNEPYGTVVQWKQSSILPKKFYDMKVTSIDQLQDVVIAFSALDSSVAYEIEQKLAERGMVVVTNTKVHRMDKYVPLVVPEVNPDQLQLIKKQNFPSGGAIVANPNCVVAGLVTALRPLQLEFGLEHVHVVTMQSISGAGLNGISSFSIMDNIIPYIDGEEEKLATEPRKILGEVTSEGVKEASITLSATCTRVPVTEGHMMAVAVKLKRQATQAEVARAFMQFTPSLEELRLPSAPKRPLYYFSELDFPQPRLHRELEDGMAVSVGSLRPCVLDDYKFVVLCHNLVRGAAGGTLLIAEMLVALGYVKW